MRLDNEDTNKAETEEEEATTTTTATSASSSFATTPAASTTPSSTSSPTPPQTMAKLLPPKNYAELQWQKASAVLRANPNLMTLQILLLALKHRPPPHVIDFMLRINPKVATSIPKHGPTPLQIAVQHNASMDVIRSLIEACPFALVATNPSEGDDLASLDPLSYVKRYKPHDKDLLELLHLPLSYWLSNNNNNNNKKTNSNNKNKPKTSVPTSVFDYKIPDQNELTNVKVICASVMKIQKRLAKEVSLCKNSISQALDQERLVLMHEFESKQTKYFKTQLIALDMKERAMLAQVKRMHDNAKNMQQTRTAAVQRRLQSFGHRITALEGRVSEDRLTAMELELKRYSSSSKTYYGNGKFRFAHDCMMPIVYATPYYEEDDENVEVQPLRPKLQYAKKRKRSIFYCFFPRRARILLDD